MSRRQGAIVERSNCRGYYTTMMIERNRVVRNYAAISAVVFCVFVSPVGLAQTTGGKPNDKKVVTPSKTPQEVAFEAMDKDKSETLNIDEFLAGSIGKAADNKRGDFRAWDIDHDNELTFDELKKRGQIPGSQPYDPRRDFKHRDRNLDGQLSLEEALAGKTGDAVQRSHMGFFVRDRDENQHLSYEEFVAQPPFDGLSPNWLFRQRDFDGNRRLTLEEYLFDRKGDNLESARNQFLLFDYNADHVLNYDEFELMPLAKPSLEIQFRGRDKDRNGKLSPKELVLFLPTEAAAQQRNIRPFDKDGDGELNLEEYRERAELGLSRQRERMWALREMWLTVGLITLDICAIFLGTFLIGRWWNRRERPSKTWVQAPYPTELSAAPSTGTTVSDETTVFEEPALPSIDDLEVT
jgi:Ca2+-binding EF-hand superfamily protein